MKEKQLLLDTLNRLWSHYLQASDCETDDNQAASVKVCVKLGYRPRKRHSSLCYYSYHLQEHWLWLLLYNFQYLDDQTLQDAHLNRQVEDSTVLACLTLHYLLSSSNFNQLPEELCFYLLEQVYQIISAAQQELETETVEKSIKQLRKQYNLAQVRQPLMRDQNGLYNCLSLQLILSTPSDCNKILALRTFLTDGLGQHLLAFLLRVPIKVSCTLTSLSWQLINCLSSSTLLRRRASVSCASTCSPTAGGVQQLCHCSHSPAFPSSLAAFI